MREVKVGDKVKFEYPGESQFNCELTVTQIVGEGEEALVFFDDGTHSRMRSLPEVKP